jgi:hypothetical protein
MRARKQIPLVVISLLLMLSGVCPAAPADSAGGRPPARPRAEVDKMFNDIMQTLPADMRLHIDSVKVRQPVLIPRRTPVPATIRQQTQTSSQTISFSSASTISQLPEELRLQVEKKIREMEALRQQRELQFKEQRQMIFQRR